MKKISGNTVLGFLFFIVAGYTMYLTNTTLSSMAPAGDPGTRLFPNMICAAIMVLAVIIIIQSFKNPVRAFEGVFASEETRQSCYRMILIVADLALFLILWNYIPFLAAGMIFMFIQCMIFKEKILFSIIYSAAVTGVLYVMFSIFLKVNLNIFG